MVTAPPRRRGRRDAAVVVLVTAGSRGTAGSLARALVAERLAACVSIVPAIRSIYRWRGEIADDAECLLLIKSRRSRFAALEARIRELHPYEVPEILALEPVTGSAPYLRWLFEATG